LSTFFKSAEQYYSEMTSTLQDVDTSPHSLIYNALMPTCYEMAYQSMMLDEVLNMVFASTAYKNGYSDYLKLRIAEVGLTPKTVETATGVISLTGTMGYTLPNGTTVSTSTGITFTTDSAATIGSDGTTYVNITATATGIIYNVDPNTITVIPIKYSGISSITNETATTGGVDAETDEELYNRYLEELQNPATSGNKADYAKWSESITGISNCLVLPLWNGGGTVKLVLTGENNSVVSSDLLTTVKNTIDPGNGDGSGLAPIGANVTVVSVTPVTLNISLKLTYDTSNYTLSQVQSNITTSLTNYLNDLAVGTTSISYNKILALIMDSAGVTDISNFTINSGTSNIALTNTQVATLGAITYA